MARIPEDELSRLKREVSLVRLVEVAGIELRGSGDNLLGRCPFHDDRTPSLVVSPQKNLWHCLGACQEGGDVISWVRKTKGVSFRHAVELLRSDAPGLVSPPSSVTTGRKPGRLTRVLPAPVAVDAEDRDVLAQVVGFYHDTLKQSPEALAYLESRGLAHPELVDRFQLGFANRSLGYRLPPMATSAGAAVRGRLQRLGVIRESGHEHFNGSLVVPLFDESGAVAGLYGRKVTASLRKGTPLHLYLPGPHRGLLNPEAVQAGEDLILCEAVLDALTFWCAGFRNVTTSYGVEGFPDELLPLMTRHGTKRVFIAYDRDEAGDRGAEAVAEKLLGAGIECYRVQFPSGMDANEYAQKAPPAERALGRLLRHAVWLGKGAAPATAPAPQPEVSIPDEIEAEASSPAADPVDLAADGAEVKAGPVSAIEAPSSTSHPRAHTFSLAASVPLAAEEAAPSPAPAVIPAPTPALAPAPAATPIPKAAPTLPAAKVDRVAVDAEVSGDEVRISFADRKYRVRGLGKNLAFDQIRVNLLASRGADAFHVDTLDLYSAKQRAAFAKQAAVELRADEDVVKRDLGRVLLKLEELQDQNIQKTLKPSAQDQADKLGDDERAAALELLQDPHLLDRVLADFDSCGVVGEHTNKLVAYLAAVSRKLDAPLAVIVQSSSAAGKTALMEAALAFVPEEDRVKYSAMTGQSLFYMGETDLQHKVLAIVEEQGAEKASYALKLLQSEGELMIASTGKDPATGRLVTQEYKVTGPVMIFLTTTAIEVDEELLNRCIVLTVDEDRDQTRAIHQRQREAQTLSGLLSRQARPGVLKVHQDAQRLLRPLLVANPYARHLTFLDDRTRTRRDHVKYLTLIRAVTLLHQYQREVKTVEHRGEVVSYVEVALADIAVANTLAHQVLGRSLDELAPQTRRLLLALDEMVAELAQAQALPRGEVRFTRKDVRARTGWNSTQVHVHLSRLVDLEHVLAHRGRQGQGYVYELLFDGRGHDGQPFLPGLIDVEALAGKATATATLRGAEPTLRGLTPDSSAPIRGAFGPVSAPLREGSTSLPPAPVLADLQSEAVETGNARRGSLSLDAVVAAPGRRNGNGAAPAPASYSGQA